MSELSKAINFLEPSNIERLRSTLIKLMRVHHINATELARRIHLPQPTIHRLIVGKTEDPKLSTLLTVADYFSITLDQLLGNVSINDNESTGNNPQVLSAPIISWTNALHPQDFIDSIDIGSWSDCFVIDMHASKHVFGLRSKPSMEPRFSTGSVLTIDPDVILQDGDIAVVYYPNTQEATIREVRLDGPKKLLRSIIDEHEIDELSKKIRIIGVVIQTRYTYKKNN